MGSLFKQIYRYTRLARIATMKICGLYPYYARAKRRNQRVTL